MANADISLVRESLCPGAGCGRRVAVLYGGKVFACRHCQRLAYKSQRVAPGDRALRRANNLRARLGWVPGVIHALADSIKALGLLQPIGIDSGYRLVFGERRLRAFKHLGRETIPVRFVNLDSLMSGELAENEFRKDFTPSERVAIGEAIEGELRARLGTNQHKKEGPENLPDPKGDTRDIAAKAAGFGNGKTYEQAKKVSNEAAPELVKAMDEGRGGCKVWRMGRPETTRYRTCRKYRPFELIQNRQMS